VELCALISVAGQRRMLSQEIAADELPGNLGVAGQVSMSLVG
jgi:hypothetical protein